MGKSAIRFDPARSFLDLFPHLLAARDRRIDEPRRASTRLLNILDRWHGRRWGPYLRETPRSLMRQRLVGYTTLGEFIDLAIAASDPDFGDVTAERGDVKADPAIGGDLVTASPSSAADTERIAGARRYLRAVDLEGPVPGGEILRSIGQSIVDMGADVPFEVLLPHLPAFADEVIDARVDPAPKLLAVFSKWRGYRWGSYLSETPASFLRQRNGGLTSLGAMIWMGARLATVEPGRRQSLSAADRGASDQAEAVKRAAMILGGSTERESVIVDARITTLARRRTFEDLGAEFGCTRERVRQVEQKFVYRIGREIDRRDSLARVAAHVRDAIGAAWPADAMADIPGLIDPVLIDSDRVETRLLLWTVGPFELVDGWLVRRPARRTIDRSRHALRVARAIGPVSVDEAIGQVIRLDIRPQVAEAWIDWLRVVRQSRGEAPSESAAR